MACGALVCVVFRVGGVDIFNCGAARPARASDATDEASPTNADIMRAQFAFY